MRTYFVIHIMQPGRSLLNVNERITITRNMILQFFISATSQ